MTETGSSIPTVIGAPAARVDAAPQPDHGDPTSFDLVADLRRARQHSMPTQV